MPQSRVPLCPRIQNIHFDSSAYRAIELTCTVEHNSGSLLHACMHAFIYFCTTAHWLPTSETRVLLLLFHFKMGTIVDTQHFCSLYAHHIWQIEKRWEKWSCTIEYRSDVIKNIFCISAFWIPSWWKTSTVQNWWESVHGTEICPHEYLMEYSLIPTPPFHGINQIDIIKERLFPKFQLILTSCAWFCALTLLHRLPY